MAHLPTVSATATADKLPLSPLLALATAVFITSLTETLPAGVLTGMSQSLGVSNSAMGQSITIYALGTVLTAVPLSAITAHWRRKRLLLAAMIGFLAANTLTALAPTFGISMVGRLLAGIAAGVAWAQLAGYARRLAPEHLSGRAIAMAMTGVPLALSLGVPAGTLIGQLLSWRAAFAVMSILTLGVIGWIIISVADFPGASRQAGVGGQRSFPKRSSLKRSSPAAALTVPGVLPVLAVTLIFVLAHTIIYTYIATYLEHVGMRDRTDLVLLVFGVASLLSIWFVGRHIDRQLRRLSLASIVAVGIAAVLFALIQQPAAIWIAAAAWGLGWGGIPTLLQTAGVSAGARHSDAAADAVQSMVVTLWNAAMAGGGILGGMILTFGGVAALPAATALISIPALIIVLAARRHGFARQLSR